MKLNNFQKNFSIFFSVIISILIVTLLWEKINLPFNNASGTKGFLVSIGYNPANDTIRYIFFIGLPLAVFLFSNQIINKKTISISKLIFEENERISVTHKSILILAIIFIIFIFLEFFSVNFDFPSYRLDHFHDGNYLTPVQNYISTKKLWTSSYLTHGGSDLLYPFLAWKILGVESIGAARTLNIFLILFLKLACLLLAYQLTKISKLNNETKILFFTILCSILISMSKYAFLEANYYFHHRDIYIILFLICFIELFIKSNFKYLSTILICLIATISILLHIDTGIYINFILFFYFLYLLIIKKYFDAILILASFLIFWIIAINFISFEEFVAFLENTKAMILSMDLMHGLKYPEPFFSIGEDPNGARATRGLLLQLTAGIFILNYLISKEEKIFTSKKIFFVFFFLLSFIMYKNALGRSDAPHLRASSDLPVLINSFFILNYLLIYLENKFSKKINNYKFFLSLSLVYLLFYYSLNNINYNFNNIKNYNKNFTNFINLKDDIFLNEKEKELIEYYSQISKNNDCIENITFDDAIPYLLKKPSCTKYWASWLTSPIALQKDYINLLKKNQPKYILYFSADHEFDGIGIYERIELVNSYVLTNYKKYDELHGYLFLEKK